ncbi:Ig-like domain-containing protein, partial [Candidatus Marinimicrobia bacterium]|nr:Ig-like domain-containing protein [Candidatus Neomarinimicrobiota bacterium]
MKHFKILITNPLIHFALNMLIFQSFIFADVPYGRKVNNSIKNIQSMMADSSHNFLSRDMDGWITNNGLVLDYHPRGDSALRFKEVSAVFQASVWAAGKVNGSLRAIVGDYTQDMGPGSYGQSGTDESYKIYYVDTKMFSNPESFDHFQNWPVNQGAPYVDVNGNGIYEPLPVGEDYPKFIGDKLAFFVANDGDPAYKLKFGTAPMNLEMQFLIYSFDQPVSAYLAQSLFYKVLVINKGSDVIEDTYLGVWFDDDLGYDGDDFVGVNVDRGLSYVYNDGEDSEMAAAGIQPFAKGSDFLQGPMIDCITGGTVSFNLSASDSDGDTLVYQVNTNPSNGSINCNSASGSCTYTPTSGYTGSDSFTYYVYESSDASRQSNTATVTINIQAARGEIGVDNILITPVSKKSFLPHPNSSELVTAMKEIKFDHHDHDHDGFVRCASDELEKELQLINPEFIKRRGEFLDLVKQNEERFRSEKRTTVDIPVIFHVLYYDEDDKITNSQISENFKQLNDDFKLQNTDKDDIPSVPNTSDAPHDPSIDYSHYDVRGTHDINFYGFDGETAGSSLNEGTTIRRYKINQQSVSGVSEASSLSSQTATDSGVTGGYQEGYLNIYIAPLTGGLLGQAYLGYPEAVVLGSTVGSLDAPGTASGYSRGRTLTHEIGHNFTYNHVFNSSSCTDQIWSDIPAQVTNNRSASYYTYVSNGIGYGGGKNAENSCITSSGKGDQFMNYMDYVYDDQMRMFSVEQALDGYSWAFSYDWFNATNSLPVANNVFLDATVNEECSEGAKMFGQRHPGKKNLKMTSFTFYLNGDATYTDPDDETEAYYYMQGLRKDGSAYPNDLAGDLYDQKFNFYGDPTVAHSNANPVDGNYAASGDRRSLMNVGPFTMAPGDSQEVVFNVMMASGADNLDALSNLFTANDSTQVWYDNDFEILNETNGVKNITISASSLEGFAPFTSTFSLNSTYQFPTYNWDFDNDGTVDSKSLNPTHTFTEAGTYIVSAKAFYNYYENGMFLMKESTDSVTVTVLDNTAITITADSLTTNEDISLSSTLSISNPSNRSFELQVGLSPLNGVVSFNNNTINYTPNNNFNGLDSLKVFAKDGSYESNEALIKINVLPVDDTPVTADVSVSTNEDTAVTVYLTASEYDGDTYEFEIKENPAHGSLSSILSSAGLDSVIYTPDADWFGTDIFKFEASDNNARMNLGTAAIQVLPINDAPITEDMTVDTYEDVTTPISLSFVDIDNDQISISVTSPAHGSVEIDNTYVEY